VSTIHEEWRTISVRPNYEVSNLGRIRNRQTLQVLRFSKLPKGYSLVSLRGEGRSKSFKVARLVATAFHANPEKLPQVNHINGIKDDDRAENLAWVSPSDNIQHAWNNGLYPRKHKIFRGHKLDVFKAREIRFLIGLGLSNTKVAAKFGVCRALISQIKAKRIWNHD
jgi:hypothetical protein